MARFNWEKCNKLYGGKGTKSSYEKEMESKKDLFIKCRICGFKVYDIKKHIKRLHKEEIKCLTKEEKTEIRQDIENYIAEKKRMASRSKK